MSFTPQQIGCLEKLVARYEAVAGRPADLATRLVLSYGATALEQGRVVSMRVGAAGNLTMEVCRAPRRNLSLP